MTTVKERIDTAAERRDQTRQARSAAAKRLAEADAALTRALNATSGEWIDKVRAEQQLPALHVARAEAQAAHDVADLAARQADSAWLLDREEFHKGAHAKALASLAAAVDRLLVEHDAYQRAWGAMRADGARFEHGGWSLLTGRLDLRTDIETWRTRLQRLGFLRED